MTQLHRISEATVLPVGGPLTAATTEREILAMLSTRRHSYVVLPGLPSLRRLGIHRLIRVSDGADGLLLWHTLQGWALCSGGGEICYPASWTELGDLLPRPGRQYPGLGYSSDCSRRFRQQLNLEQTCRYCGTRGGVENNVCSKCQDMWSAGLQ